MNEEKMQSAVATPEASHNDEDPVQSLLSLASALLDMERLRIVARLSSGPASRLELLHHTGLPHKELVRHLGLLQYFGLVKYEDLAPRDPDLYTPLVLNEETLRQARQAMGKVRGRKPRPTDARQMTLETFMPGGKLSAFPRKQEQMIIILDEVAQRFSTDKQYKEQDVNVILEEVNEDYCTLRRCLVDYGYLSRRGGVYTKND
jgi:DNA-binding transcriptional ArsR family regulator